MALLYNYDHAILNIKIQMTGFEPGSVVLEASCVTIVAFLLLRCYLLVQNIA